MRLLLKSDIGKITILSRDEKKQYAMRSRYPDKRVSFVLADVRDFQSVRGHMRGVEYVFHAAALKQVPSCEIYPYESVATNILGTHNILSAASEVGVRKVVCLSTDKAVYPVNAMGISKAMMEKIARAKQWVNTDLEVVITRYGNVLGSRGSVIPHWIERVSNRQPIQVTNPRMTRFIMSLEEAVQLVKFAMNSGQNGDILVRKSSAASIETLYRAFVEVYPEAKHCGLENIGSRLGEKLDETLISQEEWPNAKDEGEYFRINEGGARFDSSEFFDRGHTSRQVAYDSRNATQLSLEECVSLIQGANLDDNE